MHPSAETWVQLPYTALICVPVNCLPSTRKQILLSRVDDEVEMLTPLRYACDKPPQVTTDEMLARIDSTPITIIPRLFEDVSVFRAVTSQ